MNNREIMGNNKYKTGELLRKRQSIKISSSVF